MPIVNVAVFASTELAARVSPAGVPVAVSDHAPSPLAFTAATRTVYWVALVSEASVFDAVVDVVCRFDVSELLVAGLPLDLVARRPGRRPSKLTASDSSRAAAVTPATLPGLVMKFDAVASTVEQPLLLYALKV